MAVRTMLMGILLILSGTSVWADVKRADVVGTWKWISAEGKNVSYPFYMRLSLDGKAATWPAPKDWPNTVDYVSSGTWKLEKGLFTVVHSKTGDDRKSRVEIKGDTFTAITDEDVHLVYKRIVPDLEPGFLDEAAALQASKLKAADLVGTWKSVRVNGEAVDAETYMRFFADGKATAWQAKADSSAPNHGIADATWRLEKGYLSYVGNEDRQNFRAWVTIKKTEITIVTDDQTESIFRRVVPDLEPGSVSDR